jgi:hypothetical protein
MAPKPKMLLAMWKTQGRRNVVDDKSTAGESEQGSDDKLTEITIKTSK